MPRGECRSVPTFHTGHYARSRGAGLRYGLAPFADRHRCMTMRTANRPASRLIKIGNRHFFAVHGAVTPPIVNTRHNTVIPFIQYPIHCSKIPEWCSKGSHSISQLDLYVLILPWGFASLLFIASEEPHFPSLWRSQVSYRVAYINISGNFIVNHSPISYAFLISGKRYCEMPLHYRHSFVLQCGCCSRL